MKTDDSTAVPSNRSAHTPGPWQVHLDGNKRPVIYSDGMASIAELFYPAYAGTAEANARLIATAPELLDCCVKALAAWEGTGPGIDLDTLRSAIKKATGE